MCELNETEKKIVALGNECLKDFGEGKSFAEKKEQFVGLVRTAGVINVRLLYFAKMVMNSFRYTESSGTARGVYQKKIDFYASNGGAKYVL